MDLLSRRLLFVTGKGGVGKTSVAAALAHLASRSGTRTLLCEMDAKGALSWASQASSAARRASGVCGRSGPSTSSSAWRT